jgi:Fe-S-cluster-containing hydrogenase component 2
VQKEKRSISVDASKCAGCITCMLRCSFRLYSKFNLSRSRIVVDRLVGRENEFSVAFTDDCDACLICARYCQYGALTAVKAPQEEGDS